MHQHAVRIREMAIPQAVGLNILAHGGIFCAASEEAGVEAITFGEFDLGQRDILLVETGFETLLRRVHIRDIADQSFTRTGAG